MAKQNTNIKRDSYENKILDMEKKYFSIILNVIMSKPFKDDLLQIEKEIRENYADYSEVWKSKNKFKIPAERLVRHHLYMQLYEVIKEIFPSPVSSDFGIKTEDCILCVDVKTIDTVGNKGDLKSTQVEENQNSFNNKNYPGIKYESHLNAIEHYSGVPVLTYVIKIVYKDDNYSFSLCRSEFPTIVLVCIPNGKISKLFDYNIIDNFKTYKYFKPSDGKYYESIPLPKDFGKLDHTQKKTVCDDICVKRRGYADLYPQMNKIAYYDAIKKTTWILTSDDNKNCIRAVKGGSSARFNNEILRDRYDSKNILWDGYIEYTITEELR